MDAKSIKELANESFKKKDWITAFNFLLQLDSKDFISYSQKTGGRNKKQNWLIGESGKVDGSICIVHPFASYDIRVWYLDIDTSYSVLPYVASYLPPIF